MWLLQSSIAAWLSTLHETTCNFSETGGDRFQLRCFYFILSVVCPVWDWAEWRAKAVASKSVKCILCSIRWSGASVLAECSPVVILTQSARLTYCTSMSCVRHNSQTVSILAYFQVTSPGIEAACKAVAGVQWCSDTELRTPAEQRARAHAYLGA